MEVINHLIKIDRIRTEKVSSVVNGAIKNRSKSNIRFKLLFKFFEFFWILSGQMKIYGFFKKTANNSHLSIKFRNNLQLSLISLITRKHFQLSHSTHCPLQKLYFISDVESFPLHSITPLAKKFLHQPSANLSKLTSLP